MNAEMVRKKKIPVNVAVTGRSVAYMQTVGKNGKLGKATPVVLTTVRVGAAGKAARRKKK